MEFRGANYRLLGLFCAAAAVVAGLLVGAAWLAATHADKTTREHEERIMSKAVAALSRRLEVAMAPRATWDQAVVSLDNRFDHSWAAANLGALAHPSLSVNLTAVIDPDGKVLYAVKDGREIDAEGLKTFAGAIAPLVAAVRRAEEQRGELIRPSVIGQTITYPIQFSAAAVVEGLPYHLSASLVQPNFGLAMPKGSRSAIILGGRSMDARFLDEMSDRFQLNDLQLFLGDARSGADRAHAVVEDAQHRPIATLQWRASQPGLAFFRKTAPVACLVMLTLATCLYLLIRRQQRMTFRLARSEMRLQLALKAAGAGAFEVDLRNRQFWCSPQLITTLGHRPSYEEASQFPWPSVHPEDSARLVANGDLEKRQTGVSELRMIRADGTAVWVSAFIHWDEMHSHGRVTGLIQDIDQRKRQELALVDAERAAQAAVETKSRFLATVSHEIRTPMNGILGVLHLLKGQALSDDGAQLLDEALACGQMLTGLIDDVLDFSKIEAGQLELHPTPVDPALLLAGVAKILRPQCAAKGVDLETTVEPGIGWVLVDPIRLRQALFNIMGNAVKFTRVGSVHVRLIWAAEGVLRFVITDTGVGIPQAVQHAVFEQFHQGDSSTTRKFGGTGLGLAITRRLARLMGGDVDFVSQEGSGSTFWLELAAPVAEAPGPDLVEETTLPSLKILVVEDNPTNRMVATRLLEAMGVTVQTAEHGEAGVAAVAREAFDLILMDVQMPVMDGLEATRRIRAMDGPAAATPIIALTANAMTHQRDSYIHVGMNGLVAKPIVPAALMAEIARVSAAPDADDVAQAIAS